MDKKNIILIVALVVVAIFYFQIMEFLGYYTPPTSQPVVTDTVTVSQTTPETQPMPVEISAESMDVTRQVIAAQPVTDSLVSDTIIVKTQMYEIMLTSFGGGPVSIKLNNYDYRNDVKIEMLPESTSPTPEAIFAGGTFSTSNIPYTSNLQAGTYEVTSQPLEIVYTYALSVGGEIIKKYTFNPDKYNFDLVLEVNQRERFGFERKYNMMWNSPIGVTEPQSDIDYQAMEAVAMMMGERETLDDYDDNDKLNQTLAGSTSWAGVRSKYFAAVIIPRNRVAEGAIAKGFKSEKLEPDGSSVEARSITAGLEMPFANVSVISDSFTVFVGPLDYTAMSGYDVGLEDILGIGTTPFVGWIIKPFAIGLIWILPRIYDFVPNYGIVIILIAFLVKVITLPLSMKAFKSMQAMKELQPKIDELKKKHKKNPQSLNKEMMKLYKTHGVSPLSGCLPMLPQMPLLFAMFAVIRQTILLRDAPFFWFIDDLSRGASGIMDPYIILVIFMIGAQFISQKLTMATNQQNKAMIYMMPLMMGFFFYSFASGLVLYWACFSIFSLIDYFLFKRNKKNAHVKVA